MRWIGIVVAFIVATFLVSTSFAQSTGEDFILNPGMCPEPACLEVASDNSSSTSDLEPVLKAICFPRNHTQEISALDVPLSQGTVLPRFHFFASSVEENELLILSSHKWCGVRLKLNDREFEVLEAKTHLSNLASKRISEKIEGLEDQFYERCRSEFGEGPLSSKSVLGEVRSYCAQILDSVGLQVRIKRGDGTVSIYAIGNDYLIWSE